MTRILTITASPNQAASISTALAERLAGRLGHAGETVVRNLAETQPAHLDQPTIGAFYIPEDSRTPAQRDLLQESDAYIAELEAADVIILATPMHNFGIPSVLKAWIDQIARIGRTFRYTETGPEGLLTGKKVFVISSRGGDYSVASALSALDHQVPYLKTVLGFVGLSDLTFINVEGAAKGDDGVRRAEAEIDAVAMAPQIAA